MEPALVLLRDKKPCQKGWPDLFPTTNQVSAHVRKKPSRHAVGVQPASLGCVVLDCDGGDGPEVAAEIVRERLGDVILCTTPSTSGRSDRGHVWIRCQNAQSIGNWHFRLEDGIDEIRGDMRSKGGQVRLNDKALSLLVEALEAQDGLEDEAPASAFRNMRTSTSVDVDVDFNRTEGDDISEETASLLSDRLGGPESGSRHEHFFAVVADLKKTGASFDATLAFLSNHVPLWLDENGHDDQKYANAELERHLALAWQRLPKPVSAEDDFDDDIEVMETETPKKTKNPKASANPEKRLIQEMNAQYCAVLDGGHFRVFMEDFDDAFRRKVWTPLTREAFRNYLQDEKVHLPDLPRNTSKADFWLDHPDRKKFRGIVMDPEGKAYNDGKLNLWQGWAVEPKPGDWSLMKALIGDILCDGDSASEDYVHKWIAYMLQKPWLTPEAAIAFRGTEGTGKGTLGRALMRIAGPHGLTVSSRSQFAGRFNSHLRNCVFLFADEAMWPGDKDGEGIIKQLVTEPVISYEAKGKDITAGRNMVHMMLASNEEWIVPAGKEARRFFVSDVSDRRRNDQVFFGKLWQQMDNGGLSAMMYDLITLDLDDWRPSSNIPQTHALGDQKVQSLDPPSKFWLSVLTEASLTDIIFFEEEREDWHEGSVVLGQKDKELLVAAYDHFLKRNRIMSVRATHKALVTSGKAYGLETMRTGGKERSWCVPSLPEMRTRFEKCLGATGVFDAS
ncbi:MAG: DUF5906 domain-containing protein [Pseudomonadota bacterium]